MDNKVYLDNLMKYKEGTNKGKIDWKSSIGMTFKCTYDDIEYELKIIKYENNRNVIVKYKDYHDFKIYRGDIQQCEFGQYFNSIPIKNPELIQYFINGIEEAKNYTCNSHQKLFFRCPICGNITKNKKVIYSLHCKGLGCDFCGDGKSYNEKIMFYILEQMKIDFIPEYSPKWISPKRYDFYFKLNDKEYIIEMDGRFHSEYNNISNQTVKKSKEIDSYKDKVALEHDIEVIRIDCKISSLEYIRNNILNSKLAQLFNVNKIDWVKCDKFSCSNLFLTICKERALNKYKTTNYLGKKYKIHPATVGRYLTKGNLLGICEYNAKEEVVASTGIGVCVYKNGILIDEFNSILSLCNVSLDKFGVNFDWNGIKRSCITGKKYKNYNFEFKEAI